MVPYIHLSKEPDSVVLFHSCSSKSYQFFKVHNSGHTIAYPLYWFGHIQAPWKVSSLVFFGGNHLFLMPYPEALGMVDLRFQPEVGKGPRLTQLAFSIFLAM